jgi:8-oxo-dGTP pyrophosphatase MutT (NUDIX family)
MRKDRSFGIVPLRLVEGQWQVFLVQHQSGHWTLPKGHPEGTESALECAKRELFEETHLEVKKLLFEEPMTENYHFSSRGQLIYKTVGYFIAEVHGEVVLQQEELKDGRWVVLHNAQAVVTYSQMKNLLNEVIRMLPS